MSVAQATWPTSSRQVEWVQQDLEHRTGYWAGGSWLAVLLPRESFVFSSGSGLTVKDLVAFCKERPSRRLQAFSWLLDHCGFDVSFGLLSEFLLQAAVNTIMFNYKHDV